MDSIAQNKNNLQSILSQAPSLGIIASEKQDVDILSAALSLHLIFQDSGKSSQVVSKKEPIVEHSFLVGVDQLKKNFGGGATKNLTVSFPYVEGEIEKVSYNIEGDRLNVNLFGTDQGIKFDEKAIRYIREGSSPQVIVTIGIQNPQELEGLSESGAQIINIDNAVTNALFGNVVMVDPSYSSLSEVVARIAFDLGFVVEFDVAQNLLDGITHATNNFTSPKTSPLAFEMAGLLMQKGAIRKNMKDSGRTTTDTSLSMLNKKQSFSNQNGVGSVSHLPKQEFQSPVQPDNSINDNNQVFSQPATPSSRVNSFASQPQSIQQQPSFEEPAVDPIPSEDEAPSDWFMPKVFKSNKPQE